MRPRVFVVQPVASEPIEHLAKHAEIEMFPHLDRQATRAEMSAGLAAADYVFALGENPIDAEMIAAATRLKMIAVMEIFPVRIDIAAATAKGIPVTGLPPAEEITDTTGEFTFGLIMATSWRIPEADKLLRAGGWRQYQTRTLPTQRLWGKTLGIVGLGKIGRGVARFANAARMKVIYTDRARFDPSVEEAVGAEWREIGDLFAEADIVSLTTTLTRETRGLVGADLLGRMKPTALLVNTSRGPVLDESALVDALQSGRIRGAGLDVYTVEIPEPNHGPDPRLLAFDNVVLTPHIGTSAEETRRWMARQVVDNILDHINGRELSCLLNPEVVGKPPLASERIG
jgi:phosphoglycerate dehydrogenase-like enzyme